MSYVHVARQGFVTKSALPSVSRQRGPVDYASSLLVSGTGKNGAGNTLIPVDATGNRVFQRALTPFPVNASPYWPDGQWSNFFSGSSQSLSIADNAAFNLSSGSFTIEGWVFANAFATDPVMIIQKGWSPGVTYPDWGVLFPLVGGVRKLRGAIGDGSTTEQQITGSTTIVASTWYHFAFTSDGTTLRLFLNGVLEASAARTVAVGNSNRAVGIGAGNNGYNLNGYLSNVRVVKGTALYTSNFTPSTTPLTAVSGTSLLTCQSNRFKDNSSNNFAITVNGTPSALPIAPLTPPASPSSYGGSIYQTGTARQAYYTTPVTITTGEFCIEAWCYPENFSATRDFISNRAWQTGNNKGWATQIDTSGKILLTASNGVWNTFPTVITSTSSLKANAWNHVAIVRDASNVIKIFINGVQDASTVTYSASLDQFNGSFGTHYFTVGNGYGDGQFGTGGFNGYIGDVRVGTGTGSAIYTASFTPPTSALTPTTGTVTCPRSSAFLLESSASGKVLTPTGNVGQVPPTPFSTGLGSMYFDGSSSTAVIAPSDPAFNFGTNSFTIEGWIRTTSTTQDRGIIGRVASGSGRIGLTVSSSQGLWFWANEVNSGTSAACANTTVVTDGNWHHFAVVRNGNVFTLYIDGVAGSTTSTTANAIGSVVAPVYIGNDPASLSARTWLGNIANLRVVNGTALYTANFTPPTAPLTAISNTALLLLADNIGLSDSSANVYTVTGFGDAKISNAQAKYGTTSIALDGVGDYLSVANATPLQLSTTLFSLECWVYRNDIGNIHTVACKGTSTTGWLLQINASNFVTFTIGSSVVMTSTSTIAAATWTHIAVTRDGSNVMRMFINGTQQATTTNSTSFTQTDNLLIGADRSTANFFNGFIEDFRLFRDGTPYISNFTVPSADLTANAPCYRFFTNAIYGEYGNFGTGFAQGIVTRGAAPSVTRYRGTMKSAGGSLMTGYGPLGAQTNTLNFTDSSTNALTLTRSGTPRRGSMAPFRDAGYWSVNFDGSGDYLSLASSSALSFTGNFTLEAWVYVTLTPGASGMEVISKNVSGTTSWYSLAVTQSRTVTMTIWDATNVSNQAATTGTIPLNTWTHISGGRNGSTVFVSINGTYTSASLTVTPRTTDNAVTIGSNTNLSTAPFEGMISNARLSNIARYTANFSVPTGPFTVDANTAALLCNSGSFWDQSANYLQVTIGGNVAPTQDNPWVVGYTDSGVGSVCFDGTSDYVDVTNNAVLDLTSGDWTCEGWFFATAWKTGDTWVFGKDGQSGVTYQQYCVHINSSRKLVGAVGSGASAAGEQKVVGTTTLQLGCWYHFAFVKSGTTLYVFLNGRLETSATQTFTMTNGTYPLRVGGQNNTTNQDFQGMITGLRIVKGTALYTATFTPSTTPLTAVTGTSFLLNPVPYVKDLSGRNTPLRMVGNITQVPFSPFGSSYPGSYHCPAIAGAATTQGINMPMYSSQMLYLGTQDFTVECWLYVVNTGSMYGDVFYWNNPRSGATHLRIGDSGFGSKLQCATNDVSTSTVYTTPNTRATLANRWVHVALTRQSGTARVFVDGVQQNVNTGVNPSTYPLSSWTDTTDLQRGTFTFGGGVGGYVAFPHVVAGQALYTANFTRPTAPPTPVSGTIFYAPAQNYGAIDSGYQTTNQSIEVANPTDVIVTNATAPSGQSTSYALDGTRFIRLLDNSSSTFSSTSTSAFTMEAFVRFAASGAMCIAGTDASGGYYWFTRTSANTLAIGRNDSTIDLQSAALTWDTSTWYHVAVCRDSTSLRLYRDGVLLASSTSFGSTTYSVPAVLRLGARRASTGDVEFLNGNIAGFRFLKGTAAYVFGTYNVPTRPVDVSFDVPATVTNAVYGIYRSG